MDKIDKTVKVLKFGLIEEKIYRDQVRNLSAKNRKRLGNCHSLMRSIVHSSNYKSLRSDVLDKESKSSWTESFKKLMEYSLEFYKDNEGDFNTIWKHISWFSKKSTDRSMNFMPQAANRDNKGHYNTSGGGGSSYSMRIPSKKRNKRTWRNFYKLFPRMDPANIKKAEDERIANSN